jgi:hypothetical protein
LVVDYLAFAEWLELYHKGRSEAITAKQMQQWGNPREIRYLTNKARKEGFPICTCNSGYYFAANPEDINGTIKKLELQAREHLEIVQALISSKSNPYV